MAHEFCHEAHCTGCAACAACCPDSAITMSRESGGGFYPHAQKGRCAGCAPVVPCCPVQARPVLARLPRPAPYAVELGLCYRGSISGGLFPLLAGECLRRGGAVFGARWGDLHSDRPVYHGSARHMGGVSVLRGMKYLQSQTCGSYTEARWLLSGGVPVLYVGTPCQTAGLYAAVGGERDGLITCDFDCPGMPGPQFFRQWLSAVERAQGNRAEMVFFHGKSRELAPAYVEIQFADGSQVRRPLQETAYGAAPARPCCGHCAFRDAPRVADVTLGGTFALANSERGRALLDAALPDAPRR